MERWNAQAACDASVHLCQDNTTSPQEATRGQLGLQLCPQLAFGGRNPSALQGELAEVI